ncbi:hypothetical protein M3Y99_00149800 [Aphelenchoides fujianensis]|nr:hypothetical protein M3Y99_00149800 [Aphelenchoides fujianensis]
MPPLSSVAASRRPLAFQTIALVFVLLVDVCSASMSPHFRRFVRKNYGAALERELNRADLGPGGSFGGGRHRARTPTENRPVLLVHGITNRAATFDGIRKYFLHHDYTDAEVYGTTYGDAGKTNVVFVTMNCHYSKMKRVTGVFRRGYEGARTYTIASTGDEKVGYMACGRKASEIPGQTQMFTKTGMNHDHVMFDTVGLQYNLVTHGRP